MRGLVGVIQLHCTTLRYVQHTSSRILYSVCGLRIIVEWISWTTTTTTDCTTTLVRRGVSLFPLLGRTRRGRAVVGTAFTVVVYYAVVWTTVCVLLSACYTLELGSWILSGWIAGWLFTRLGTWGVCAKRDSYSSSIEVLCHAAVIFLSPAKTCSSL